MGLVFSSTLVLTACKSQNHADFTQELLKPQSASTIHVKSKFKLIPDATKIDYASFVKTTIPNWSASVAEAKLQKVYQKYQKPMVNRLKKAQTKIGRQQLLNGRPDTDRQAALGYLVINYLSLTKYRQVGVDQLKMLHTLMMQKGRLGVNRANFSQSAVDYAFTHVDHEIKALFAYYHQHDANTDWDDQYLLGTTKAGKHNDK